MRALAKLGVFSFWIVSTVIYSMMTDIFVGTVLGAAMTAVVGFAAEYWTGLFTE